PLASLGQDHCGTVISHHDLCLLLLQIRHRGSMELGGNRLQMRLYGSDTASSDISACWQAKRHWLPVGSGLRATKLVTSMGGTHPVVDGHISPSLLLQKLGALRLHQGQASHRRHDSNRICRLVHPDCHCGYLLCSYETNELRGLSRLTSHPVLWIHWLRHDSRRLRPGLYLGMCRHFLFRPSFAIRHH
ncbi:hypothetical protein LTR40_014745, partial [Exophiala xenobiotica]